MMAYETFESTWDNFGKFIQQLQPEIKTLIGKLERILINLFRQNVSLLFNQTCLDGGVLLNYTHTHARASLSLSLSLYIYIYIYIYIWRGECDFKR